MLVRVTYPKTPDLTFKWFLSLAAIGFAVSATLLLIFFTTAATDTGRSPALAITLVPGRNSGILGPNQQRWYRVATDPDAAIFDVEQSLTLIFSPTRPNLARHISLHVYEAAQLIDRENDHRLTGLGQGALTEHDADPKTGDLVWTGQFSADKVYYVQVQNDSDFPIDYWLFRDESEAEAIAVTGTTPDEAVVPAAPPLAQPAAPAPAAVPAPELLVPEMGVGPSLAVSLNPGMHQGRLKPNDVYWFTFTGDALAQGSERFQALKLNMFFTPDDGNRRHFVNFELFPAGEVEAWQRGQRDRLNNFGAGMLVSRDGDPNTGERIWQGVVLREDTYFLAVENKTEVEIDYWLINQDMPNPDLGRPVDASVQPVANRQGTVPQTAIPLSLERNKGQLAPGQETWYSFSIADQDDDYFEAAALTMIFTPDNGQRIHQVTFEVFTAEGIRLWSRGNQGNVTNVGAGSIVYRDDNPLTGERFWSGWVVDNDIYYVRVRNGADAAAGNGGPVDYWLFNGDVYRPGLD